MSKKIVINTMNTTTLSILSDFNIAYKAICEYNRQKKEELKKIDAEIEAYKAKVPSEITQPDGTVTTNPEYSLSEFEKKIGKVEAWYKSVTEPLKEKQAPALKLVDKEVYYAYAVSMLKGSLSSTGKITLEGKKDKTVYEVKVSYLKQMKDFLESMGLDASNNTALEKCAKSLALRCGGMMKDNNGDYLKLRNKTNFQQIVILAFLQYAIIDRKAIILKADNSLALNLGQEA